MTTTTLHTAATELGRVEEHIHPFYVQAGASTACAMDKIIHKAAEEMASIAVGSNDTTESKTHASIQNLCSTLEQKFDKDQARTSQSAVNFEGCATEISKAVHTLTAQLNEMKPMSTAQENEYEIL